MGVLIVKYVQAYVLGERWHTSGLISRHQIVWMDIFVESAFRPLNVTFKRLQIVLVGALDIDL